MKDKKIDLVHKSQIKNSFKWSALTELLVKLIAPILNAILARILLPEDFAPLATITMIITFGEIFVESGFKKYLVQHEFSDGADYKNSLDVALWSNLAISAVLWILLTVFSKPLAAFLGSPDIWQAIIASGVILPLYSIIGILSGKLQKEFKFKKLFVVRIVTASIPLFVTVPLAFLGLEYWSLVIGNIASILAQAIVLMLLTGYRPRAFYSIALFKEMYSYGIWTLLDGLVVWGTTWIDTFIISKYMTEYYLGMYKNSVSTVHALFSIVTAAVVPVLFVGLSKLQNDNDEFSAFFNSTQRKLAMILLPLGTGVLLYSDIAVLVLFGENWMEASNIVGITAITTAFRTIYVSICSDAYRAKAKFKIPLFLQLIDLCILVPSCIISAQQGFWALVYVRALAKLVLIVPEMIVMHKVLDINAIDQLKKSAPIYICTLIMAVFCIFAKQISGSFLWSFITIAFAIVIYAVVMMLFPSVRKELFEIDIFKKVVNKLSKRKH